MWLFTKVHVYELEVQKLIKKAVGIAFLCNGRFTFGKCGFFKVDDDVGVHCKFSSLDN